jgi:hypothetical protein
MRVGETDFVARVDVLDGIASNDRRLGHLPSYSEAFRASVIADACGLHRVSVARTLKDVHSPFHATVNGRAVPAYRVDQLPHTIKRRLVEKGRRLGLDPLAILRNTEAKRPWSPKVPFTQASAADQEKARLTRAAFERVFLLQDTRPLDELRQIGLADYRQHLGYEITPRHWDSLYKRITARAGCSDDFERLDLYLPGNVTAAPPKKDAPAVSSPMTDGALDLIADPEHLSPEERAAIWEALVADFELALGQGIKATAARRQILSRLLAQLPSFSASFEALQRSFRTKLKEGKQNIRDKRKGRSGRKPKIEADANLIAARMLQNRGYFLQSWQELWDEGKLHESAYLHGNRERAPAAIQEEARILWKRLEVNHAGRSYERLKSPKVARKWDDLPAGFQAQTDDMTSNHYFYHFTPNGQYECAEGRFDLTRGQLLPWMDTRSRLILTALILPKGSFNQIDIYRSYRQLHDAYGLPPEIHNERGIFKKALTISGRESSGLLSQQSRVYGWKDHGVTVRHALHPQGKPLERAFAEIQKYTDKERGYAGRNERKDMPDATKRALQLVKAGKAHPAEFFLSFDELCAVYQAAFLRYNRTPQPGSKALRGLSPAEAFAKFYDPERCTPIRFEPPFDYLLCSHRRECKITQNGIKSPFAKGEWYVGEATGRRLGETVLVYFDFDRPEYVIITDLDGKNPDKVDRQIQIDAFGQKGEEQIAEAMRQIHAHRKATRGAYINLTETYPEEFANRRRRALVADAASLDRANAFAQAKAEAEEDLNETRRSRDRAARYLRKIGATNRLDPSRADSQANAAKELARLLKKASRE